MLSNIYEFNEIRHREGRNVLMGRKWNYIYAFPLKLFGILKVKITLVKAGYYDTEYTTCILLF
jgi:hypothetical protein